VIRQGDIYWADLGEARGSQPGDRRPVLVIQNDVFNASRIRTVLVCALTSNLRRAAAPGNVQLAAGEANLTRDSVVNVSQMATLDRAQLEDWVGRIGPHRIRQVVRGILLVVVPSEVDAA
jgi:mRNA interferase MazF